MTAFACSPVELSLAMGARCGPRRPCPVCRIAESITTERDKVLKGRPLLALASPFPWHVVSAKLMGRGIAVLSGDDCRDVVTEHSARRAAKAKDGCKP